MGNGAEAGLIDQFTSNAAYPIGFILDAHQGLFEVIDKGDLAAGHLSQLLTLHAHASVFHGHVTSILKIAAFVLSGDQTLQISQLFFGSIQLAGDDLAKLGEV